MNKNVSLETKVDHFGLKTYRQMRADCLKMKILQLKKIRSGGQRFAFKIPHLP